MPNPISVCDATHPWRTQAILSRHRSLLVRNSCCQRQHQQPARLNIEFTERASELLSSNVDFKSDVNSAAIHRIANRKASQSDRYPHEKFRRLVYFGLSDMCHDSSSPLRPLCCRSLISYDLQETAQGKFRGLAPMSPRFRHAVQCCKHGKHGKFVKRARPWSDVSACGTR